MPSGQSGPHLSSSTPCERRVRGRGPGRRADRRGRCDDRCDEPGDGRGRSRQHRQQAPVSCRPRYRPRRGGDEAGGRARDRVRVGRRSAAQGQDGPGPSVASSSGQRRGGWPEPTRGARGAVRRPRCTSSGFSRISSRRRRGSTALGSFRSPAPVGSVRAGLPGSSGSTSTGSVEPVWWHQGRSPAYGEGITFWALGEMVRERAGLLENDDEPTTRAKIAETVARARSRRSRSTLDRAGATHPPRARRRSCRV